ncbi:SMI1/KNR4 family protein [Roseateles chitosanitabidus]|uniref:SMI1/KNR4 family protein n=1 Tax=Roseateles chitosanitabidus TaxID=65048 RepID=UPI00082B3FB8|nr:SMI1/KNR4 family protein [Roseateles chitosanitabidus]
MNSFWRNSDYAKREYVGPPCTPGLVAEVEARLGYRLPDAYVSLAMSQNGGMPVRTSHRTKTRTSWAEDHIAITGIFSIGYDKPYSLCGERGSRFWVEEWGYPDIGIYFADCPSAGHDMLCLDYRACGSQGKPSVVHVDQELDYAITLVAPDFESFLRGLEDIGEAW